MYGKNLSSRTMQNDIRLLLKVLTKEELDLYYENQVKKAKNPACSMVKEEMKLRDDRLPKA